MTVFELFGTIAIDNDQANSAIDGTTDKAAQSSNSMGNAFKKIGGAVATYFAADKIIEFGKACVNAAAEVSAEVSAFEQIMGDYSAEASEKIGAIAEATGIVDSRLTPYMTSLTAKFKGLGFDITDATDMASTGLTIAADAAAFWDKSLDDAMGALNSFVNGSYEGGESIGLFANETTLATWAADNLGLAWADLTEKEKQFARLEFAKAMQEASGAAGQAAKESDQYANVLANLNEKWRQFKAEIGEPILQNVVIPGMQLLSDVVDFASDNLSDIIIVAAEVATVMAGNLAGKAVKNVATVFMANAEALAYFTTESGKAAVAEATLTGTFSVGEIAVGVLTGKISLATAAQYAWNTAMNANPIGIVIALVSALTIAVSKSRKHVSGLANSYVKQADSSAECAKNLEDLKTRYAELTKGENNPNKWVQENRTEINALAEAIEETEQQLEQLQQAETEAADAMADLTTETDSSAETIQAAAETYAASVQSIMEDYYNTYKSIYDGLHKTGTAFMEVTSATEIAWADAMKNIDHNTQFLENMDSNLALVSQAADDAGINIDGFKQMLSTMSDSDAAGLVASLAGELEKVGENSTDAADILSKLSLATERYADAGLESADIMAQAVEEVDARIKEATENYEAAVADLDMGAEAIEAGRNTMEGLASGIASGTSGVLTKMDSLASQMKSRLTASFSNFVLNIQATVSGNVPGHEDGLDRVPYDNYLAYLHKDEAVLTASEARAWRAGKAAASSSRTEDSEDSGNKGANRGITIIQHIQAVAQTPVELAAATEAYFTQARWSV